MYKKLRSGPCLQSQHSLVRRWEVLSSMKDQIRLTLVRTDQSTRCDDEKLLSSWEYRWKSWKLWFWAGFWRMYEQRLCGKRQVKWKMEPRPRWGSHRLDTGRARSVCDVGGRGDSLGTISKIQPPFSFLSAVGLEDTEREETLLLPHGPLFSFTFLLAITG